MEIPRVRTLEESQNLPDDAKSWLEIKKGTGTALMYNTFGESLGRTMLWPENYGKTWRLWDKKATKAQRKATPWL